ncbi:class II aldolase/adducin family protein [Anoxybacterium hadale]|uniref:Class II aldolase/adducin family protein n=1 Tax=Anoxybacterium hadale TaxID=3408580 RepID=A0ACD1ABM9_9FIRM|nr:class II aldolase/adducin family protein [Clostridiales bacterium]
MKEKEAKELVVQAGIELVHSGLIARTWGNVSCRIDQETFVITPSGRDYLTLTPEDIVPVRIADLGYEGSVKPSSEKGIHAEVYRLFPEINFAIHTHQEYASAVSAAGLDFMPLSGKNEHFSEKVLCARYALPGTKSLRRNVAEALRKSTSNAVILKHHGTLCYGNDYDNALKTALELEKLCCDFVEKPTKISRRKPLDSMQRDKDQTQAGSGERDTYQANGNPFAYALKQAVLEKKGGFVLLNHDPEVVHYSQLTRPLHPFLDDFAQIVGIRAKVAENDNNSILKGLQHGSAVFIRNCGAVCWGKNERDAEAVSMILRKNCRAYFTAAIFGRPKPINGFESALMRLVYLKKYSKLAE